MTEGWSLHGNAELQTDWRGGWQTLQQQLQAAGLLAGAPAKGANTADGFELQASRRATPYAARRRQRRAPHAGTAAHQRQPGRPARPGRLQWDGELRQRSDAASPSCAPSCSCRPRPAAAAPAAGRRQITSLQLGGRQRQPGPWTLRLANALSLELRQSPQLALQASAGQASIKARPLALYSCTGNRWATHRAPRARPGCAARAS